MYNTYPYHTCICETRNLCNRISGNNLFLERNETQLYPAGVTSQEGELRASRDSSIIDGINYGDTNNQISSMSRQAKARMIQWLSKF
uniref:Uncharacterized protein n=1 Tax=Glossina pallidipes TaxID=7398 RepID=A0A1B0AHX4_GLOPL